MSNGIDSLADSKAPGYLMNILESHPDMTYQGQSFAGPLVETNIINIENSSDPMLVQPDMFGADMDSTRNSGLTDRDAMSTSELTGNVKNDND
jgi:hypothetical protein